MSLDESKTLNVLGRSHISGRKRVSGAFGFFTSAATFSVQNDFMVLSKARKKRHGHNARRAADSTQDQLQKLLQSSFVGVTFESRTVQPPGSLTIISFFGLKRRGHIMIALQPDQANSVKLAGGNIVCLHKKHTMVAGALAPNVVSLHVFNVAQHFVCFTGYTTQFRDAYCIERYTSHSKIPFKCSPPPRSLPPSKRQTHEAHDVKIPFRILESGHTTTPNA